MEYFEHQDLAEVYLEDSFVLGLDAGPNTVTMRIELVLREGHPLYRPPIAGEQYCYATARFLYSDVKSLTWRMPTGPPATDATGEADYGGLEQYTINDDCHHFVGEIGEVDINCGGFTVDCD